MNDKKELISIKDFAEKIDVSVSYVNKVLRQKDSQLCNLLTSFIVAKEDKKYIKANAVQVYNEFKTTKQLKREEKQLQPNKASATKEKACNHTTNYNSQLETEILILKEKLQSQENLLKAKDENILLLRNQKEQLQEQVAQQYVNINSLTKALDQQQQLQAALQKQLLLIEEKQKNNSIWNKIFKTKKEDF